MSIYAYKCRACGTTEDSTHRGDVLRDCECGGRLTRVFVVSLNKPMMAHFNSTVGKEISDMGTFKNELKKASDDYYQRTGIESDFQPIDRKELVIPDGKGLDKTNRDRVARGLPALKLPE
jgi:hypothetical protein